MMRKIVLALVFITFCIQVQSQDYPFDLPEDFTATLNVNTAKEEAFNNLLLGTNIHDLAHSEGQALLRDFDPITIRFPHGLFANWYDWEQDKARVYGTDQFTYQKADGSNRTVELSYLNSIKTMDRSNLIVGINGVTTLNNEKKAENGEGYDMMWTFNMSADGTDFNNGCPVSVARYNDLLRRGLQVKAIEMGNENFYAGQRSSIIPNHSDYITRAKSMYKALKALDPDLKLSVNLERKSVPANTGWNTDLTKDGTDYFDAVSVHTYVGHDPDDPANGNEAFSVALTAREVLRKTIDDYSKVVAPDKPIWLTEWGVRSGGPNAVSALGMADCYLFMSENQDTYERANWFSVNGKLNSHLVWHTVNGKSVIKVPYEQTSYGSTYQILRSVFENSTMLACNMEVPSLDGVVNAVNARAVIKEGKTFILAINLSNQEVPFAINMDGNRFFGEFEHKAFAFGAMDEEITLPYGTDALNLVKEGQGGIYLPKYSINVIELKDNKVMPLDFVGLENNQEIDKGSSLTIEARVADEFKEVALYINDTLLATKTSGPYIWSGFSQLANMMLNSYELKLVAKTQGEELLERVITITTPEQWAYTVGFKPHAIPGKIEVEDYDYGGENIAYYDKAPQSASYHYRGEDKVDLSPDGKWLRYIQGREWLEYTVEVKRSGNYNLAIKHETRRSPEFEAMSFSFSDQNTPLFKDLVCTNTGSGVSTVDTFKTSYLEKGRHILRLDILSYGWDLDYFEFILASNPIDYFNLGILSNSANPDSYNNGDVIQHLKTPLDSAGFNFAGWFTNAECTDTISIPAVASSQNEGVQFYAKWEPKTLAGTAIVYGDIISGKTLVADVSSVENNSGILSYQWQQSSGETFININGATSNTYILQNSDVGTKLRVKITSSLQNGEIFSNTTNTILNVNDTYLTISYEANGGSDGNITSEIVGVGGNPTFVAQPTKEGYVVSAWANSNGDIVTSASIINSDTTLYAIWDVKNKYKVRFYTGDQFVELETEGYPAFISSFPEEPLKADSLFYRWYTKGGERFEESSLVYSDLDVFSTWKVKRFAINVSAPNGNVVYNPPQNTYEIHSEVILTAKQTSKYEFVNWTGDFVSTDTAITVFVDSTINLFAHYQKRPYYKLDVYYSKGEVLKFPNSSRYLSGSTVTLTATPSVGYAFDYWSGDYSGTENPLTLEMAVDMEIYANFKQATSVNSLTKNKVRVSPNPSQGTFTINLDYQIEASYKLFSLSGVLIAEQQFSSSTVVELKDKKPGIYLLIVATEHSEKVQRIIVK